MTKKALIIMGHGSRRTEANIEFESYARNLAAADRASEAPQYDFVSAAFLELTSPTMMQACAEAIEQSCSSIDVYPLFLNQGRHVEKDIPQQLAEVMDQHPDIEVRLLDYMGSSNDLTGFILNHLRTQNS